MSSSAQEEEKKATILYVPDVSDLVKANIDDKGFDLETAISNSRYVNSVFNVNASFEDLKYMQQPLVGQPNSSFKLNMTSLNELNSSSIISQSHDDEVISSSKNTEYTEYSVSPQ